MGAAAANGPDYQDFDVEGLPFVRISWINGGTNQTSFINLFVFSENAVAV
jgi:hypothetical protein